MTRSTFLGIIIYIFYNHSFSFRKINHSKWYMVVGGRKKTRDIIAETNDSYIWRRAILYVGLLSYLFTDLSCQYYPFATFSCWMDDRYEISERIDRSEIEIVVYWKPTATNPSKTILVKVILRLSLKLQFFVVKAIDNCVYE